MLVPPQIDVPAFAAVIAADKASSMAAANRFTTALRRRALAIPALAAVRCGLFLASVMHPVNAFKCAIREKVLIQNALTSSGKEVCER
jgi:hypothetical protein